MTGNEHAAHELAERGIPVFPAIVAREAGGYLSKRPAITGWQTSATTDPNTITAWWATFPSAVPGVELGRAGLVVLDLDRHAGGADGVEAFRQLRRGRELPVSPVTRTASGGFHIYFRQPDGEPLGNGRGDLPAGIDVRGAGGWTVAPGAVWRGHRWSAISGRPELARDTAPAMPEWLLGIIRPPKRERSESSSTRWSGTKGMLASLGGLVRTVANAPTGQRNQALFWAACRAGEMVHAGKIGANLATELLAEAAEHVGLPRHETLRTIHSGLKSAKGL